MTYLSKLKKTQQHKGIIPTIRHAIRFTLQKPAYPILSNIVSPKTHEKMIAAPVLGYWPQIENPRSFNEKIIARKLSRDKTDIFSKISNKYAVKEYVRKKIDEDILADIYYIGDEPEDIPFDELPDEFVVKATHGSSMAIIVKNKQECEIDSIISECKSWLNTPYGKKSREYWYEDIPPKIIVEEYIDDPEHHVPQDFKFYVFNGHTEFIHVDFNRFSGGRSRRFFDREWNACDFRLDYPLGPVIEKPDRLNEMVRIAETLGKEFDFVRVDLYHTKDNKIYFGEMTLAPGAGSETFYPVEWDFKLGSYWE